MRVSLPAVLCVSLLAATSAGAGGLDRDSILTDAPATPDQGTVRITGGGDGATSTVEGGSATGGVSATVSWTPARHLSGDVGAYVQSGDRQGPSARLRYQLLDQEQFGLDLTAGVRFKTVGFHPDQGELEFLIAAGRRIGQFDLVLNGVFGVETGGESGKDLEVKAFGGYRFGDAVRAGLDFALKAEVEDAAASAAPKIGRDFDLITGPAVSWMVLKNVQLQALAGVAAPKRTDRVAPTGVLSASIDF